MFASVAQEANIKQLCIGDQWSSGYGIKKIGSNYIVGGLTAYTGENSVFLFMGVMDQNGNILQFDTLQETNYIISLNLNNDIIIRDNKAYWSSIGSGSFIIYSYDINTNEVEEHYILETFNLNFSGVHFCFSENQDRIYITGIFNEGNEIDFGILMIENDTIIQYKESIPGHRAFGRKLFQRPEGRILSLSEYRNGDTITVKLDVFDSELNNLEARIIEQGQNIQVGLTDAIIDSEGQIVYCALRPGEVIVDFIPRTTWFPQISKIGTDNSLDWTTEIGYGFNDLDQFSNWYAIEEAENSDGYFVAGTSYFNKLEEDTIISKANVVKLSSIGNVEWYREFVSIDTTRALHEFRGISTDNAGGMIAVGFDQHLFPADKPYHFLYIRLDENGDLDTTVSTLLIEPTNPLLKLYPNPSSGIYKIDYNEVNNPIKTIKVYNSEGMIVKQVLGSFKFLSLTEMTSGSYFVIFEFNDKTIMVEKVIKV